MDQERRQGKCLPCRVRYTWDARLRPLWAAYCPSCGSQLRQTSYQLRWPVVVLGRRHQLGDRPVCEGTAVLMVARRGPEYRRQWNKLARV